MKSTMITIMKKEFARFFGDKRMVFTSLLMPGLIIYIMYSFMGNAFSEKFSTSEEYTYQIVAENLPQSFAFLETMEQVELTKAENTMEEMQEKLLDESVDLYMVFPKEFDAEVAAYEVASGKAAPNVELYQNSSNVNSSNAYRLMDEILNQYESQVANKFDVCAGEKEYDVATEEDGTKMMFSMLLPMIILMFLFSGCLAIASESIAGEKERGTIATLLVTPMKRSNLSLGKILSLSVLGILSGISSFIGTILSIPKLMGGMADEVSIASVYGVKEYALIFVVIVTTTLVLVGILSIISALSKSIKEASTATLPLMLVIIVLCVTNMMGEAPTNPAFFLIPIYNAIQCLTGIFAMNIATTNILITVASNIVCAGGLVFALTKIFGSEKIMYN